jgi:RluA family pseudouridine synthase
LRIIDYFVPQSHDGRTVKSLLTGELHCSGTLIKRLKLTPGSVTLNGENVIMVKTRVRAGDMLSVDVDDAGEFVPADTCEIPILYEDEDIIIVDKPAGMAVHATGGTEYAGTVDEILSRYTGGRALHALNRLDRGTSGVMVAAKSAYAHELLRGTLHSGAFLREYIAVAVGTVTPSAGVIDAPIARDTESLIKRKVSPEGMPSRTRYETLKVLDGMTLLRVMPETGRTHQIRVHFAHIGHPLVGDWLYGEERRELIARPALHSYRVRMKSPVTGVEVDVTAEVAEDIEQIIRNR